MSYSYCHTSSESESPVAQNFELFGNFPSTVDKLEAEILYWWNLREFVNLPWSSSHDSAIGEIVNVLETVSSLPPRPDQRERFSAALSVFNRLQNDWNYGVEEVSPTTPLVLPQSYMHESSWFHGVDETFFQPSVQTTPPVSPHNSLHQFECSYGVEDLSSDYDEIPATLYLSHTSDTIPTHHHISQTSYSDSSSSSLITPPASPNSNRTSSSKGEHYCSDCHQSFARVNSLNRHISSIHNRVVVACPWCLRKKNTFNRSDNFQRHVLKAHRNVRDNDETFLRCVQTLYHGQAMRRMSWRRA